MSADRPASDPSALVPTTLATVPALFAQAGERSTRRLLEFFAAEIRSPNTRASYARATFRFSEWCDKHGLRLVRLQPLHAAAYVEELGKTHSKPTVKQHLAALRMLGDYLVTGQVIAANPFGPVRGPKYVVRKGKTPVLSAEEMRQLLDSIDLAVDGDGNRVVKEPHQLTIADLRDRALISVMAYSFARISAVLAMNVGDYRQQGKRCWLALHEKGGKEHEVPCHHKAEAYLDAYIAAAGIINEKQSPLFRRLDRRRRLTTGRLDRREALAMVKRRAVAAGLGNLVCNHSFRATGVTVYLQRGGVLEKPSSSLPTSRRARQNFMTAPKTRSAWKKSSASSSNYACSRSPSRPSAQGDPSVLAPGRSGRVSVPKGSRNPFFTAGC